jgi:hypothetical protein
VKLPKSLKDISVQQYQEIHPSILKIAELTDTLDKALEWCKIISVLTVKHIDEIEAIDLNILKGYIKQLSFLMEDKERLVTKFIWINGCLYKGTNNAEGLNASQVVAIKTFLSQGNYIDQMHNLAPCVYKKFKLKHQYKAGGKIITEYCKFVYEGSDHIKVSNAILKKSSYDIIPVVFFCSRVLRNLMEGSEHYLQAKKIIADRMVEISRLVLEESSLNIGDGMPQLTK